MGTASNLSNNVTRRHVVGIVGLAGIGFIGWFSSANGNDGSTCHYSMTVQAVAVTNVSSDEIVYDAEADGYTEIAPLADALTEAHSEYQDGKAVDVDELDVIIDESNHVLAQKQASRDLLLVHGRIQDRPLVEYQGQIYQLSHAENNC